jgi:GNAT superfamily N-acetyltransferase
VAKTPKTDIIQISSLDNIPKKRYCIKNFGYQPLAVMNVESLGYRTDLIFHSFDGEIIDRGDYLVIRTPMNPTFYWGNFLLFSQPPNEGDFREWRALFALEIGVPPETKHQVFGWDSPEGEEGVIQPFLQAGFRVNREVILTTSEPRSPARPSDLVSIRALKTEADWEQAVENQVVCREPEFEESEYREFRMRQMDRYRKMVAASLGDWFGAFADQQLVADLGLFHAEGVGRFQSVETHPDFRRRGIAGALIFGAARQAKAEYDLHTLVIVAEQASNPARLYESLGFQLTEKQVGLEWWPQATPVS